MVEIILVDDNNTVIDALLRLVPWEENGYHIAGTFKNGQDALDFILQNPHIHIIFTDIKMPVMDGITLLKQLQQHAITAKPIVLSSYDEYSLVRSAFTVGAIDYILKSEIDPDSILAVCDPIKQDILSHQSIDLHEIPENRCIMMVLDRIEAQLDQNINLKIIADQLSISSGYLGQLFYKYKNETFSDYLNKRRVQKATQMLSEKNYKIYEIAFACGYNNVEHFSRIFKKITGKTPKQWYSRLTKNSH